MTNYDTSQAIDLMEDVADLHDRGLLKKIEPPLQESIDTFVNKKDWANFLIFGK